MLLHDVRAPPGHAADREDRGPEVGGDPEERVRRRRVVVDVHHVDLCRGRGRHLGTLPFDLGSETFLDLEVLRTLPILGELLRELPQKFGARILGLVDAVAEAGELVLRGDRLFDPRFGALGRADLIEHLHRPVGRAAVKGSLQRAKSGGHRGVHVGVRPGGDPRRKGGRVEAVLGLQDEAGVQDLGGARMVEAGHLREVGGVAERRIRGDWLFAPPPADVRGEHRRQLRGEAQRLRVLRFPGVVALSGVFG